MECIPTRKRSGELVNSYWYVWNKYKTMQAALQGLADLRKGAWKVRLMGDDKPRIFQHRIEHIYYELKTKP